MSLWKIFAVTWGCCIPQCVYGSDIDTIDDLTDCVLRTENPKADFVLKDLHNRSMRGVEWEFQEQEALCKYVYSTDRVLQLGGNIGGTCVAASRLTRPGSVLCVEPNQAVLPTLYQNRKDTKSDFDILEGVVAELPCKTRIGRCLGPNCWGSASSETGTLVGCTPLAEVKKAFGAISVLFADCEGCLPLFLAMYPTLIADPDLRTIIYEFDSNPSGYSKMEKQLLAAGFELAQNQFVKVWVREKKPAEIRGVDFIRPVRQWLPSVEFINLQTSQSRLVESKRTLDQFGLTYKRRPAIDRERAKAEVTKLNYTFDDRVTKLPEPVKWGTVACYLSHLELVTSLLRHRSSQSEPVMIMEDDFEFPEGWDVHFASAWRHLPEDWEIFKPCYWGGSRESDLVNSFVAKAKAPGYMGTCGYIVRPSALGKVLRVLQTVGKSALDDVDVVLLKSDVITYVPRSAVILHKNGFSDRLQDHAKERKLQRFPRALASAPAADGKEPMYNAGSVDEGNREVFAIDNAGPAPARALAPASAPHAFAPAAAPFRSRAALRDFAVDGDAPIKRDKNKVEKRWEIRQQGKREERDQKEEEDSAFGKSSVTELSTFPHGLPVAFLQVAAVAITLTLGLLVLNRMSRQSVRSDESTHLTVGENME